MSQSTDSRKHLSLMLSEVLDDIGINEKSRKTRRRFIKLTNSMYNVSSKSTGRNKKTYTLGSKSEGTTTFGLQSDYDTVFGLYNYNVIQNWSEWEHGKKNYFMIQDEITTPGYCFLQLLQHDKPLRATVVPDKCHITDRKGRILHMNTMPDGLDNIEGTTRHGPSITAHGLRGLNDTDTVTAYPCKSWPKSVASDWLKRIGKWPTQAMRRKAARTVCFVVPTGSKTAKFPEYEWRISTSLAENCLMFDLRMTQIKCYVLMKMILKYYLNPQGKINISSFMCKTVLFHYIENKEASIWEENNLIECLKDCLMNLYICVQNNHLSHFIIPKNNLMGGQFTAETKIQLLKNITYFLQNDAQSLFRINIDHLGHRLQVKLNIVHVVPKGQYILNSEQDFQLFYLTSCIEIARQLSETHFKDIMLLHIKDFGIMKLKQYLERLMTYNNNDNEFKHTAFKYLAPLFFSTYGSALASESIGLKNQVSPQAFVWLSGGLDSDITSGKLKLASVFYSTGDMEKTELILRHTESEYNSHPVLSICCCFDVKTPLSIILKVLEVCNEQNEDSFKKISALCVRFFKQEINCVPHELKYEMFRSTQDDRIHRHKYFDYWMDWALVDSLPLLYFLQYKVYKQFYRHKDQQQALNKLANIIETEKYLGHKETALNILGQCMEQENRPKQAIKCYLLSLQERARNNVANIHICRLLSSLVVGKEN